MSKIVSYIFLPVATLALVGVSVASAHGWFAPLTDSPEDVVKRQQTIFQEQAGLLGVSEDVVKDAWAQGKSLPELAQELGISQDELRTKMQDVRQSRLEEDLQALVAAGVITQEQADQRLEFMKQRADEGFGFGHRRQMMKGFGF